MPNEKKNDEEHGVRLSYKFRIYPTAAQCEAIGSFKLNDKRRRQSNGRIGD